MAKIENLDELIALLEGLATNPDALAVIPLEKRIALFKAAGQLSRPNRLEIMRRQKSYKKIHRKKLLMRDRASRASTGIREARLASVFQAPAQITSGPAEKPGPELIYSRHCYVCRNEYTKLHSYYDSMCVACGDFNYQKRFQTAPLHGQVAVITGAR